VVPSPKLYQVKPHGVVDETVLLYSDPFPNQLVIHTCRPELIRSIIVEKRVSVSSESAR
jgi:hypothetical protein